MLVKICDEHAIRKNYYSDEQNWVDREYDDNLGSLLILRKPFRRDSMACIFSSVEQVLYYEEKNSLYGNQHLCKS